MFETKTGVKVYVRIQIGDKLVLEKYCTGVTPEKAGGVIKPGQVHRGMLVHDISVQSIIKSLIFF